MINWVDNDDQALLHEYEIEYKLHVKSWAGNVFPTPEDFLNAYHQGEDMAVTPENVGQIGNATNFPKPESLFNLIKSYRSYPQFRNETTFQAIIDGMENGAPMKKPIILRNQGRLTIMSGNTRQNLALIIDGQAIARVVDMPSPTSEARSLINRIRRITDGKEKEKFRQP